MASAPVVQASLRRARRLRDLIAFSLRVVWADARSTFVALVICQIAAAVLLSAQVLAIQWLLNSLLGLTGGGSPLGTIAPICVLVLLTAGGAVTGSISGSLSRLVGETVAHRMWQSVLDVSTGVGLRAFESSDFFDHLDRIRTNALTRPLQVTNGLVTALGAAVAGLGLGITLIAFNPLLLPLLLLAGVPLLLASRRESRLEFDFTVRQTQAFRLRAYLTIVLTGRDEAKEVRAFGSAANLRGRFSALYRRYLDDLALHLRRRALLSGAGQLGSALVLGLTLLAVVWLIANGGLSIAAAGAALVAVRLMAAQVQALFGSIQSIFESGLFIDDLQSFLDLAPKQPSGPAAIPLDFAEIVASHVSFTYPGREQPALRDVSVRIGRGQVVALVGENGSGKTTLAKVIAGLYPVDGGTVTWDGVDEAALPAGTARASTAVIFQDFVRYSMDLGTNIALGRPERELDEEQLVRAADASGVASFVGELPNGYETTLTRLFDGGHELSGGQWQRVAIARAFYRDAPLVILDEPSAALDPRAEYDLFSSLRTAIRGRSALIISHRFSTVRNADRIYVMDEGVVAEEGTHDQLMQRGGIYAELFRLQAAAYLPDQEA